MRKLLTLIASTAILSSVAAAGPLEREILFYLESLESIKVVKASDDLVFPVVKGQRFAEVPPTKLPIYWILKRGLNVEYQCVNESQDAGKDMCSRITLEVQDLGAANHPYIELTNGSGHVFINHKHQPRGSTWKAKAKLDTSGISGDVKSTGTLILSAAI